VRSASLPRLHRCVRFSRCPLDALRRRLVLVSTFPLPTVIAKVANAEASYTWAFSHAASRPPSIVFRKVRSRNGLNVSVGSVGRPPSRRPRSRRNGRLCLSVHPGSIKNLMVAAASIADMAAELSWSATTTSKLSRRAESLCSRFRQQCSSARLSTTLPKT